MSHLEGSLVDMPTVIKRETREQVPEGDLLGTSSETTYMEIPNPVQRQYIKVLLLKYLNPYKEQKKQVEQRHWHQLDYSLLLWTEEMLMFQLETN